MRGQTLDVTSAVKPGRNDMTVRVTNTLINRVAGWTRTPPLPPNLQALYGRGVNDDTPQGRRLYGFSPLPRSGLLGPGGRHPAPARARELEVAAGDWRGERLRRAGTLQRWDECADGPTDRRAR